MKTATVSAPQSSIEISRRLALIDVEMKQAEQAGDFTRSEALRAERFALAPQLKRVRAEELRALIAEEEPIIRQSDDAQTALNDRANELMNTRAAKVMEIDREINEALFAVQANAETKRAAKERVKALAAQLTAIEQQ